MKDILGYTTPQIGNGLSSSHIKSNCINIRMKKITLIKSITCSRTYIDLPFHKSNNGKPDSWLYFCLVLLADSSR